MNVRHFSPRTLWPRLFGTKSWTLQPTLWRQFSPRSFPAKSLGPIFFPTRHVGSPWRTYTCEQNEDVNSTVIDISAKIHESANTAIFSYHTFIDIHFFQCFSWAEIRPQPQLELLWYFPNLELKISYCNKKNICNTNRKKSTGVVKILRTSCLLSCLPVINTSFLLFTTF